MELMATSLDKFYKFVYCTLDAVIPEEILGKITLAVSLRRTRLLLLAAFHVGKLAETGCSVSRRL